MCGIKPHYSNMCGIKPYYSNMCGIKQPYFNTVVIAECPIPLPIGIYSVLAYIVAAVAAGWKVP